MQPATRADREQLILDHAWLIEVVFVKYYRRFARWKEDLFQAGYVGLCKAANSCKPGMPLKPYAWQAIRRHMSNFLKRDRGRESDVQLSTIEDADDFFADSKARHSQSEVATRDRLRCLNPRDRYVIERRLEGYTCKEIAKRMGISRKRVYQLTQRSGDRICNS